MATQFPRIMPRYNYIISKYLDPLFAITIGVGAAAVRIRREEKLKGRTASETWALGTRRLKYAVGMNVDGMPGTTKGAGS